VVFVCQNNHWAISVPRERQTRSRTLAQKALAYGMPGVLVDGNDLFAVHAASEDAVQRAREGEGPTLIECDTYRMEVHTTADDPTKYRDDAEVEAWAERDPIDRVICYAREHSIVEAAVVEAFEEQVDEEIAKAWEETSQRIEQLAAEPMAMFDYLYESASPTVREQQSGYERYLDGGGK
jgi:TPP-dependent pyruvate/acetoin dehydrogenase alpha subunit